MAKTPLFLAGGDSEAERNDFAQGELPLRRLVRSADVPVEIIRAQKSSAAALSLAVQASGLDDKEICLSLSLSAAHFSEIKHGKKHFPADLIPQLCETVGNRIYPEWIASRVGCGLYMLKTEAQRRIDELEAALAKERERRQWAEDIATRKGS